MTLLLDSNYDKPQNSNGDKKKAIFDKTQKLKFQRKNLNLLQHSKFGQHSDTQRDSMFRSSQQTATVSNKQILAAPVQDAVFFFFIKFQSIA